MAGAPLEVNAPANRFADIRAIPRSAWMTALSELHWTYVCARERGRNPGLSSSMELPARTPPLLWHAGRRIYFSNVFIGSDQAHARPASGRNGRNESSGCGTGA